MPRISYEEVMEARRLAQRAVDAKYNEERAEQIKLWADILEAYYNQQQAVRS
jgi:hypothetical protein